VTSVLEGGFPVRLGRWWTVRGNPPPAGALRLAT